MSGASICVRRALAGLSLAALCACASAPATTRVADVAPHASQPTQKLSATPLLAGVGFLAGLFHGGPQASRASSQRDAVIGAVIGGAIGLFIDSRASRDHGAELQGVEKHAP